MHDEFARLFRGKLSWKLMPSLLHCAVVLYAIIFKFLKTRLRSNINIKKVHKQDLKSKNVKGCRDGMPKSMQTRWG